MASCNVVGRTDEMLYDFRLWCSAVACTDDHNLQQTSRRLEIQLEDSNLASRRMVTTKMLQRLSFIENRVFSGPPPAAAENGFPAEDQQSTTTSYKQKRRHGEKIVFLSRRILMEIDPIDELHLCPPIYARHITGNWQCTTFRETWNNRETRIVSGLPDWIGDDNHELMKFLKTESQAFGMAEHLLVTNALYVVVIEEPKLRTEDEESCGEGDFQETGGEMSQESDESSVGESFGSPAASSSLQSIQSIESSDEEGERCDEGDSEENDREMLQESDESTNGESSGCSAPSSVLLSSIESNDEGERCTSEDTSGRPAAVAAEEEGSRQPYAEEWCKREQGQEQDEQKNPVNYYAGQTLRDVVRRCKDHCRKAKLVLDEASKYEEFGHFERAVSARKVLLVEAYLAAAKATGGRCAVFVVRGFVDRKAELIRRFRLTDMRRGLNGGRAVQTKITDFFAAAASGSHDDVKSEDNKYVY